jgi:hypothetical protein
VSWATLDGQAPADADVHHAEGVLRLLGLTVRDAAEVARRPLPPARTEVTIILDKIISMGYGLDYETSNDSRRPDR